MADVLLVAALVVILGVTAKTVLDQGSAHTADEAPEALLGDRRDGGVAGSLTAGAPGSLVTHRVTAGGTLVVKQRLVTSTATRVLMLSNGGAPLVAEGEGDAVVRDLTVSVGGSQVEPTQTTLEPGESTEVALDDSASEFLLAYVVEGAVATSSPSTSRRALVELETVRTDEITGPRILRVRAGETGDVLSLACGPSLADAEPCGREGTEGWSVRLPEADPDTAVFASVDLPTG